MEKSGGSRLLQMQARFQQKQLQEREMKIASLYEAQQAKALGKVRHSPSNSLKAASPPPQPAIATQPGKVRQMFEERRTKAGIDKSYPLQPIQNTEKGRKALPNGYSKVTSSVTSRVSVEKKTRTHTITNGVKKQYHRVDTIVNGAGDLNHNHEADLNDVKKVMPQCNGEIIPLDEVDKAVNNYLLEDETFPEALAPAATPRSPEPEPKKPPRRSPSTRSSPPKTKPTLGAPARRAASDNAVSESSNKAAPAMQRNVKPSTSVAPKARSVTAARASPTPRATTGAGSAGSTAGGSAGGAACGVCGRRFASDRVAKHQEICKKAANKKRKPYDILKHRLAGTEAEPFITKLRKTNTNPSTTKLKKNLNSNWRQKHEEFIQAIRAAKQVQDHLNKGGKLSDLPPPPPSENPDYVACPHCGRRFNQGAAERHVPKCATYQFNKPKPNAKRR